MTHMCLVLELSITRVCDKQLSEPVAHKYKKCRVFYDKQKVLIAWVQRVRHMEWYTKPGSKCNLQKHQSWQKVLIDCRLRDAATLIRHPHGWEIAAGRWKNRHFFKLCKKDWMEICESVLHSELHAIAALSECHSICWCCSSRTKPCKVQSLHLPRSLNDNRHNAKQMFWSINFSLNPEWDPLHDAKGEKKHFLSSIQCGGEACAELTKFI